MVDASSTRGVPPVSTLVIAGLAASVIFSPPASAQINCSGINTDVLHSESTEAPQFEGCEQLQGTEATEAAAIVAAAPSAQAAGIGIVRSQTLAVTNAISDRIRAMSRDLARGLEQSASQPIGSSYRGFAAGSPDSRWGVWGDASGSFLRNNTAIGYNGPSVVALAGADYILAQEWIVGFSAGYTHANLALKSITGNRVSDGAVIAPYVSYIVSPNFSLDGQFNYTRLSNTVTETGPGPSSAFDGNRLTGAVNLNGYADAGPIKLTGFSGYAYTWEGSSNTVLSNVPPFSNNIHYGVFKLGGEAGYQIEQLEAYVPLTFEYETTRPQDRTSRTALVVGAGLRYQWNDQVKAGLLATTTELKTHWQDVKVEANLRWTF